MAGGRPTKYTPEILEKAHKYLGGDYEFIPSIAELSEYIGVSRDTVHEWRKDKQEFSDIVSRIMAKQERMLFEEGLKGEYNASIAKLMLTKHGYSDKVDSNQNINADVNANVDGNWQVEFVNASPESQS